MHVCVLTIMCVCVSVLEFVFDQLTMHMCMCVNEGWGTGERNVKGMERR